jgi:hypothetical protein
VLFRSRSALIGTDAFQETDVFGVTLSLTKWSRLANFCFWEPAHFIMERKMLLTIKQLSERGF